MSAIPYPRRLRSAACAIALWLVPLGLSAQNPDQNDENDRPRNPNQMRRASGADSERARTPGGRRAAARFPDEVRTIDGSANNADHPSWGAAGTTFLRLAENEYEGATGDAPGVRRRFSARSVSNFCVAQDAATPDAGNVTDFFWQWGQFLDHDLDLTPEVEPVETFDIRVPPGDSWFDPAGQGGVTMHFGRSSYDDSSGVREQLNAITAFIDASNVYGSDDERALALRTLDGTGKLKTSAGNLLPFNDDGLPNAGGPGDHLYLAGDFRANEQVGLLALHTLFVREHNRLVDDVIDTEGLSGDEIYETARALVGAMMQRITYSEFLPVLLGEDALPDYRGYGDDVDPSISNEFATAAYRFGHSMVSPNLLRLDARGDEIADGHLSLAQAFFRPDHIQRAGIGPVLRGLAAQTAQRLDVHVIDELRNLLFGAPGSGGLDLPALNIQRGRDHGLAGYNNLRRALGLAAVTDFASVGRDDETAECLDRAYVGVGQIDLWVGGISEAPVGDGLVGETFRALLIDQFTRLRDGDRFWYRSYLPRQWVDWVERQTLARVVQRNTGIGDELQDDVFRSATSP